MFGQSNNTPFGSGGGFGQPTQPAFGTPAPAQTSIFGSPAPSGFGQPTANSFGGQPTAPAPSYGGFGAPAGPPGGSNMFGAPAPAAFGGFGAPASAPFGSTNTGGGGLFGNSNPGTTNTGFGQSTGGGGLFGQQPPAPSAFGAPTSTFGAPTPAFGAPSSGLFGAPAPAFGSPAPSAFGAPAPAFGAPAPSAFGAPAPSSGFFGSPAPAPFGAPAPAPTGLFGSAPAPSSGFGGSGMFGSNPAPAPFGSPPPSAGGFGAPSSGLFGAPAVASSGSGTRVAPYETTSRQDGTANINLQSISAMEAYKDQSHEELRFGDYSQGNRGTAAPAPSMFGGFGAPAPAPIGGGLFGSTAPAANNFGSTSGGLFGTNTAPTFASPPAPLGGFGQSPGGGLFGQTPAPATTFGAPTSSFGAPVSSFGGVPSSTFGAPAPSGGLFGAPAPTSLFGNPAPAPFGAPAPTGLFGGAQAPSSSFGGTSSFGTSPSPGLFGAPAPGLFGAPAPAPGGLFGSQPPAAPYGQSSAFGAPAPSLFGSAPAPAFGAPPPSGFFGQSAAVQQQQPQQMQAMFNAQIIAPGVSEVIEQQIRALDNQLNELKKMEVWKGPRASSSPATTPTSVPDTFRFFSPTSRSGGMPYSTPQSTTKVRPRGFAQAEPPNVVAASLSARRDNSALMSPEAFVRSSQLNLVVRPDSLRRSNKLNLQLGTNDSKSPDVRLVETIEPPPTEESPVALPRSNHDGSAGMSRKPSPLRVNERPAISPGLEYYQQVVGNSIDESSLPMAPSANGISNTTPWYVPKLTKMGYEVSPTVAELSGMSEADLASVQKFAVRRPGYGKVEWEGSVDVRGANLDDIVVIEVKDVSVYNSDEEKGTKPEEGTKLNRPAVITFDDVFPKEGARASPEVMEKFTKKVKKAAQSMNAEFVSYDSGTGIWKIRVHHFSRYALMDDESDDNDDEITSPKNKSQLVSTHQRSSFKNVRKATPYKPSRMTLEDMDVSERDDDFLSDKVMMSDSEVTVMNTKEEAEEAARAIKSAMDENPASSIIYFGETEVDVDEDADDDIVSAERTVYEEQLDQETMLRASRGNSIFMDSIHTNPSNVVCGTHMGRSFRVGWLPNGAFLKLSAMSEKSNTTLVISQPILSDRTMYSSTISLLESQRENAILLSTGNDECPLYKLSRDCRHVASVLPEFDEANLVFLLLSRLFPPDCAERSTPFFEEKVPSEARCLNAVHAFLRDLCSMDACSVKREDISGICEPFFRGNVALACQLATSGGYSAIATILASTPNCQEDVLRFLSDIEQSGDLNYDINPAAWRILKNLGGEFKWEDSSFREGITNLDWCRRLILRIEQRPDDTLQQLLRNYESSLIAGDVPFPHPPHLVGSTSKVKSFFYKLLHLCGNPAVMTVREALHPCGYTPYGHDFSLSFHFASALASVSDNLFQLSTLDAEFIKDGYETQLVLGGYWEWAVFVSLCCIDNNGTQLPLQNWRRARAKNLILQHYHKNDPRAQQRRDFLEQNIGVPSFWFDEALCYRAAHDGDSVACIAHASAFDVDFGSEAFIEFKLPKLVLGTSSNEISSLLTSLALYAPRNSVAVAVYRFVELEKEMTAFTTTLEVRGNEVDDEIIQQLQENLDDVYDFFFQLNELLEKDHHSSHSFLSNSLLFPSSPNPVHFSSMVSELFRKVVKHKENFKVLIA
jgi:Nucleoporin autopeptidase/Nuclear protein 96/Nucleoporin FG repeat region